MTYKIHLNLGLDNPFDPKTEVIDSESWNDEDICPTTLKDISIIMYSLTGVGVTENLAKEIAERIPDSNIHNIKMILFEIFYKYSIMDEEEAYKKAFQTGG